MNIIELQVEPKVVQEVQLDEARVALIDRMLDLMVWLDKRKMSDVLMPFQKNILRNFLARVGVEPLMLGYLRRLLPFTKKKAKCFLLLLVLMFVFHTKKP